MAREEQRMMLRMTAPRHQAEGRRDKIDDVDEPLNEFEASSLAFACPSLPCETAQDVDGRPCLPGETKNRLTDRCGRSAGFTH